MIRPPDRQLLGYLAAYNPHVSDLTLALREVVLEEAPDAIESISRGYAPAMGVSFTGKPLKDGFCHIVTYETHVNLGCFPTPQWSPGWDRQVDSAYYDPRSERTGRSGYPTIPPGGD